VDRPEQAAKRFEPGGIVVDANAYSGTKTVLESIADIRKKFASVPLVVIGDEMSAQLILAAFRAGADDFFDRDTSEIEIRSALLARLRERAAVNERNGAAALVGVLSPSPADEDHDLSLNIAALLAAADSERRVLLLDLSLPSSPAGPALGLELSYTISAAVREMGRLDKTFLDSALAKSAETNLYVLPLADGAAANLPSLHDVSLLLQILRALFDVVVIHWGAFSRQAALTGAPEEGGHFLLCCNQRFSSIRNAKDFLAELKSRDAGRVAPLLAIHHLDAEMSPTPDDIAEALGAQRKLVLPATWSQLARAQNRGQPVSFAGPSRYGEALRTYLAEAGLYSFSEPADRRAANPFRWLRKVRG
jgi:pilus assembly protein CpaE